MSSNLKDLELELSIAKKFNFEKREIDNLKRLIENEKSKNGEKTKMNNLKKIILWLIGIILMASYSYLQADIVKVQVKKPKIKKQEYPKPKKTLPAQKQEVEIEYEMVESDKTELAQNAK